MPNIRYLLCLSIVHFTPVLALDLQQGLVLIHAVEDHLYTIDDPVRSTNTGTDSENDLLRSHSIYVTYRCTSSNPCPLLLVSS